VLGHLVYLAEATHLSVGLDMLRRGPVPDKMLTHTALALGRHPVAELSDRLLRSASGHYHVPGPPRIVALGEVLVHGEDMMRPLGAHGDEVDPRIITPVLPWFRRLGRLGFHGTPRSGVTLVATDTDASIGSGPEVRGRAIDLLLLVANRRQVLAELDGPGLDSVT